MEPTSESQCYFSAIPRDVFSIIIGLIPGKCSQARLSLVSSSWNQGIDKSWRDQKIELATYEDFREIHGDDCVITKTLLAVVENDPDCHAEDHSCRPDGKTMERLAAEAFQITMKGLRHEYNRAAIKLLAEYYTVGCVSDQNLGPHITVCHWRCTLLDVEIKTYEAYISNYSGPIDATYVLLAISQYEPVEFIEHLLKYYVLADEFICCKFGTTCPRGGEMLMDAICGHEYYQYLDAHGCFDSDHMSALRARLGLPVAPDYCKVPSGYSPAPMCENPHAHM